MTTPKDQLAATAKQLQQWRATKPYRNSAIPEALRQQIIALFEHFPVYELQPALNMSGSLLYRWAKQSTAPVISTKTVEPATDFVELPTAQIADVGHVCFEFDMANHSRMRLSGDISTAQLDVLTRNIFMHSMGGTTV